MSTIKIITFDDLPFKASLIENSCKHLTFLKVPQTEAMCVFYSVAIWARVFTTKPIELAKKVRECVAEYIREEYPDEGELLEQLQAGGTVDKGVFRYIAEIFKMNIILMVV